MSVCLLKLQKGHVTKACGNQEVWVGSAFGKIIMDHSSFLLDDTDVCPKYTVYLIVFYLIYFLKV